MKASTPTQKASKHVINIVYKRRRRVNACREDYKPTHTCVCTYTLHHREMFLLQQQCLFSLAIALLSMLRSASASGVFDKLYNG